MPSLNYIEKNVAECKKNFFGMIDHPYIKKYVEPPVVDEDKVRFIYAMLGDFLPEQEIKVYALATLLVDASLNTHDLVSLNKINSDYIKKNRQLTVLGGDYYSSLYYNLLSQNDYVPMINVFAVAIQIINQHKMILYNNKDLPFEKVKESISLIESALLVKIADHYHLPQWTSIIKEYFFLKRFLAETQKLPLGRKKPIIGSIINERFKQQFSLDEFDLKKLKFACNLKIEKSKDIILANLKEIAIKPTFIIHYIERFVNSHIYKEKVAEEG